MYWARIAQVRTWKDALAEGLVELLLFNLPLGTGEPKFRILVARRGASGYMGVRALAEVDEILATTTPEVARTLLVLNFE